MVKRAMPSRERTLAVSEREWTVLLWALEVAHALLLADPDVAVLLADPAVSADFVDGLADRLVTMLHLTPETER